METPQITEWLLPYTPVVLTVLFVWYYTPLHKLLLHKFADAAGMLETFEKCIHVKDGSTAARAMLIRGDLGLGEAFMDGDLTFKRQDGDQAASEENSASSENLSDMEASALEFFRTAVDPETSIVYRKWWAPYVAHVYVLSTWLVDRVMNFQSVSRSSKAIAAHYDEQTRVIEVLKSYQNTVCRCPSHIQCSPSFFVVKSQI